MATSRTVGGRQESVTIVLTSVQTGLPYFGSCSHGSHGPISAPSERRLAKPPKCDSIPIPDVVVERFLLVFERLGRQNRQTHQNLRKDSKIVVALESLFWDP